MVTNGAASRAFSAAWMRSKNYEYPQGVLFPEAALLRGMLAQIRARRETDLRALEMMQTEVSVASAPDAATNCSSSASIAVPISLAGA